MTGNEFNEDGTLNATHQYNLSIDGDRIWGEGIGTNADDIPPGRYSRERTGLVFSAPHLTTAPTLVREDVPETDQETIMEVRERLRQIYELVKGSGNAELQEKLLELREDFLALQIDMQFDGSVYWRFQAGYRDGPFCPDCLNLRNLLALLERRESDYNKLVCKLCNGEFTNAAKTWSP